MTDMPKSPEGVAIPNMFDPVAFGQMVVAKLERDRISFREAAPLIPCSPATLNRVARNKAPDVENYLRITHWLSEVPAVVVSRDPMGEGGLVERLRSPKFQYLGEISSVLAEAATALEEADRAHDAMSHEWNAAEANVQGLEGEVARLKQRALDDNYMIAALVNMLGPNGLAVWKKWRDDGVKRIHVSWGPDVADLTGEERAAALLEFAEAAKDAVLIDNLDGDFPSTALSPNPDNPNTSGEHGKGEGSPNRAAAKHGGAGHA